MAKAKKSAPVKLAPGKLQELKDAIVAGEAPKSIHERLGASLANIHYHKGELKKKGLLNPAPAKKAAQPKRGAVKQVPVANKVKAVTKAPVAAKEVSKSKAFRLIVNGISVDIDGASSVSVGEGFIKVDF